MKSEVKIEELRSSVERDSLMASSDMGGRCMGGRCMGEDVWVEGGGEVRKVENFFSIGQSNRVLGPRQGPCINGYKWI